MAKKFFMVYAVDPGQIRLDSNPFFTTKDAAIEQAKRTLASNQKGGYNYDVYVVEAIAALQMPVPNVEVVDLTATTTA